MLLITHSLGLGSVWVELAPVMRIVREVLAENVVKEDTAVAVLPIGRPAEVQQEIIDRTRKKIEELAEYH